MVLFLWLASGATCHGSGALEPRDSVTDSHQFFCQVRLEGLGINFSYARHVRTLFFTANLASKKNYLKVSHMLPSTYDVPLSLHVQDSGEGSKRIHAN